MKGKKEFTAGGLCLVGFIAILIMVLTVDVAPVGPEGSRIGLSGLNQAVFQALGTNELCYKITQILGDGVLLLTVVFAFIGLLQLVKRKSLRAVDFDLYYLAGFYIVMLATYMLFEKVCINYRPVLEDGKLEASFPSSHTLLAVCLMGSTFIQIGIRIKKENVKRILQLCCAIIMAVIVIGRLLAGVHWFTDILAGTLLGFTYVFVYAGLVKYKLKTS